MSRNSVHTIHMATYVNISKEEMTEFLEDLGFQTVELPRVRELVWGKIIRPRTCLRVYTGITGEDSRDVGQDAIRCTVFHKNSEGEIKLLGGSKRVHRVQGWKANLTSRIEETTRKFQQEQLCPLCGSQMAIRVAKQSKNEFWGCTNFPTCKGTLLYEGS